jgi:hypothetical protein
MNIGDLAQVNNSAEVRDLSGKQGIIMKFIRQSCINELDLVPCAWTLIDGRLRLLRVTALDVLSK